MKHLLMLNGPNLNLLGSREPGVYGSETLADIENKVKQLADDHGFGFQSFQSNHEGELIDAIHQARESVTGIIFNPGAYTHTSIALRDAIAGVDIPVIEVHISNVHQRESFRHTSLIAPVTIGQIVGLGTFGYSLAALALIDHYREENESGETK